MADKSNHFSQLPSAAHGLVLSELWQRGQQNILHIAVNDRAMQQVAAELAFFVPNAKILTLPAWDVMPYDRISPKANIMAARMQTLAEVITSNEPFILLATVASAMQKLPPKEIVGKVGAVAKRGQKISQATLINALTLQGYSRVGKAMEAGEFAVRGSILDIIPAGSNDGFRLDWFGDELETLKRFDPMTQISEGSADSITLTPTSEVLLTEESIARFRENFRELFGSVSKENPLYETISQGSAYAGMEHFLPLFYPQTQTLFDYVGDALITLDDEAQKTASERAETITDYYQARIEADAASKKMSFAAAEKYYPIPPERFFISESDWKAIERQPNCCLFSAFHAGDSATDLGIRKQLPFKQGQADNTPFDQLREQLNRAAEQKKMLLIACATTGSRDRLQSLLMDRGFHAITTDSWKSALTTKGKTIALATLAIEDGFETPHTVIFSEQDVLGERMQRTTRKKKSSEAFFAEAASFNEGELVVHKEHGIARFAGLVTVEVQGAKHDCLLLMYEGDDKLFLPVENIELVTRYGSEDDGARLDKLGGASWQSRKAKLKKRISIAAEALLKIAAERITRKAPIMSAESGSYDEFAARFGFMETEDQARAITEVAEDLQAGKPMDRLVCGDVGFGKTEVALRAAFIAAMGENKMQVALICPTTLLARQHHNNFASRFAGFPVKVRQLSRMVTPKQQKETIEGIKNGEVDIVIGTHALLAKGVEFKNLGLLIVDEEQHFGVAQKEKLKSLKSDVHVLTLSATPIPRTLQMALTGVRDLSLITTPPVDRLAIRSFVMPFDPVTIREGVMRELHRSGRVFVVTPRIKHLAELKTQLSSLVPEAKIAVAHGGLPAAELDRVMNDFYDGKYNLLLSTAIIESGLDIPTANTMIIHNAHMFGLSQLYQMRGRVGRGKTRAYAYFMLPHHRELTANAAKRLEVMQTLDTLGAGFTLANHDMDIRGFGNLVGEEQSGHIKEVGIELYQQMLEEAVANLKHEASDETVLTQTDFTPQINLGLSVLIPEYYVNDLSLRMGLYKRASSMQDDAEIDSFAAELVDRFGAMPEETRHLIDVLSLKLLCRKAGIERVDVGPKGATIGFFQNHFAKPEELIAFVERRISTLKIRPDQKLFFSKEWKNKADTITTLKKLLGEIGALLN